MIFSLVGVFAFSEIALRLDLAERLPERVVVRRRQPWLIASEEVRRQAGAAQNVRGGDAEVGKQQA
jgi:hypothetical protein